MRKSLMIVLLLGIQGTYGHAQGLVSRVSDISPGCGSFDYLENLERRNPGFINSSNGYLENLVSGISSQKLLKKTDTGVLKVPVVFHVVYNSTDENISDSVIANQLVLMNQCFRRQNADTVDLRSDFTEIVDDARIEFVLAEEDPNGMPSTGITRTNSFVKYFGGVLPYGAGQNVEILKWVNDSLYLNIARLSATNQGGIDPWDPNKYLNIWIGDLRVFEPKNNNFEELLFFALATPPTGHPSWSGYPGLDKLLLDLEDGVYLHYTNTGPGNPSKLPPPYDGLNGLVTEGKILVHEVGHYLGLRHIWGDGDCSKDDYIDDTPRSNNSSNYGCIKSKNTCKDTINGSDMPDMVENYMDYSSNNCQNSFTKTQIAVMRQVILNGRQTVSTVPGKQVTDGFSIYPNPSHGIVYIQIPGANYTGIEVNIWDSQGRLVMQEFVTGKLRSELPVHLMTGMYIIEVRSDDMYRRQKLAVFGFNQN